jgi:hypothetical protein
VGSADPFLIWGFCDFSPRSEHAHVRAGSADLFRIWGCSTPPWE